MSFTCKYEQNGGSVDHASFTTVSLAMIITTQPFAEPPDDEQDEQDDSNHLQEQSNDRQNLACFQPACKIISRAFVNT